MCTWGCLEGWNWTLFYITNRKQLALHDCWCFWSQTYQYQASEVTIWGSNFSSHSVYCSVKIDMIKLYLVYVDKERKFILWCYTFTELNQCCKCMNIGLVKSMFTLADGQFSEENLPMWFLHHAAQMSNNSECFSGLFTIQILHDCDPKTPELRYFYLLYLPFIVFTYLAKSRLGSWSKTLFTCQSSGIFWPDKGYLALHLSSSFLPPIIHPLVFL